MKNKIAIGILAHNEESHIKKVIKDISSLNVDFYVLDDFSTDKTPSIIKNLNKDLKFTIIENIKNEGAGSSTLKLLEKIKDDGFEYLIKVDGDNQFKLDDVKKMIRLFNENNYDFIKSNRFWEKGIEGKIPNKRYFGNLFATMILQFVSGTNKLFDPLNGLFGVNVKVLNYIERNVYPKRYGYPFYFSSLSAISFFKIFQINNTMPMEPKSNLSSIKMFFANQTYFSFLNIKNQNQNVNWKISTFSISRYFFTFLFLTLLTFIRFVPF